MFITFFQALLAGLACGVLAGCSASNLVVPSAVSCPAANGTIYTTTSGDNFVIECKFDRLGGDMQMKYTNNFQNCIDLCSSTANCVDVSYSGTACYMKDKTNDGHAAPCSGARLLPPDGTVGHTSSTCRPADCSPTSSHSSTTSAKAASSSSSSQSTKASSSSTKSTNAVSASSSSAIRPSSYNSSGCGKPLPSNLSPSGPSQTMTFTTSSGTQRTYKIYIPSAYSSTTPAPLIVSYHGHSADASAQEAQSQFSTDPINPDHIVIYPNGIDESWQGAPYASPGVDDIAFTTELLADLSTTYCIDPARRYATGHSNGGGFVGTLACSATGSAPFAAFAASSGAFYQNVSDSSDSSSSDSCSGSAVPMLPCTPAHAPTPFLEVHGTADGTIPYDGGAHEGECMPSLPHYARSWASRDGFAAMQNSSVEVANSTAGEVTTRYVWDDGATVVHFRVEGLGHTWATDYGGFSTSPTMMGWLQGWTL